MPSISEMIASLLGHARLEQFLDARQTLVMSSPATPPVWKVRMVSCVPGSPIDWRR